MLLMVCMQLAELDRPSHRHLDTSMFSQWEPDAMGSVDVIAFLRDQAYHRILPSACQCPSCTRCPVTPEP